MNPKTSLTRDKNQSLLTQEEKGAETNWYAVASDPKMTDDKAGRDCSTLKFSKPFSKADQVAEAHPSQQKFPTLKQAGNAENIGTTQLDGIPLHQDQSQRQQLSQQERYRPPKWKQIKHETLERQIKATLQQVGNVDSVIRVCEKIPGEILHIGEKREALFNEFHWHREQINFVCRLFKDRQSFNQWFHIYSSDNKGLRHPPSFCDSGNNLLNKDKLGSKKRDTKWEERKGKKIWWMEQQKKPETKAEESISNQHGSASQDQMVEKMLQLRKNHHQKMVQAHVIARKWKREAKFYKDQAEAYKQQLEEHLKAYLQQSTEIASVKEQLDEVRRRLIQQQKNNPLIISDDWKTKKSKLRERIQPDKFKLQGPTMGFFWSQFYWGRRRFNNKQWQYEGDFRYPGLWSQLEYDLIYLEGGRKFLVIVVDPPWVGTGMKLPYETMTNEQFFNSIPWDRLQDDGYLFLWVTQAQMEDALKQINDRGYMKCDILVWVKLNKDKTLNNNIGYYSRHVAEFCIIARKRGEFAELKEQTVLHYLSNVIIEEVGLASQKPTKFYEFVEEFIPHDRYLDLCGRQCGQRERWITVGIQSIDMNLQQPQGSLIPYSFYQPLDPSQPIIFPT